MLERRIWADFRCAARPLACLLASAMVMSTSPVHAQSDDATSTGAVLTDAPLGSAQFATTTFATAAFGTTGSLGLGAAALAVATSAAAPSPTTPPAAPVAAAPSKEDGTGLRTAGYLAGGVGIAGFILFAIAGIGAKRAHDRLDENCRSGPCDEASRQSDVEDGKLLQTAANIGLATGLTGFGLGATLIVLGGRSNDTGSTTTASGPGGMITYGARF